MRIQKMYGLFSGEDVYVVGTGASQRVMDFSFFDDRNTLGLNQAYRYFSPDLSLTVHPELVLEYEKLLASGQAHETQWFVKIKPPMGDLTLDDDRYLVFRTSTDLDTIKNRPDDTLYLAEGIQATAVDLAARMGARAIILVGCDACSLRGEYHGHDQHVRWLGQQPDTQYELYRKSTAKARRVVREEFGIPVLTLSPFVGVGHAEEDYARLCQERGLVPLPAPKDTSTYTRK